jgi:hypothetical protein
MVSTEETRKMPRARLALPIALRAPGWEIVGETLNVSPGGCAMLLDEEPPKGSMRFSLRLPSLVAEGTARVVNSIEYGGKFYVSIAFARLETVARPQLIEAVLRALDGA